MAYRTEISRVLLGRHVVPPPDVALFLGALIISSLFADAEPLADTHFTGGALLISNRITLKRKQNAKFNRHIYRQIEPGTFAYIRGYQRRFAAGVVPRAGGVLQRHDDPLIEAADVKFNPGQTLDGTAHTKREFDPLGVIRAVPQPRHAHQHLEVAELGEINDLIQTMNITELNEFLDQQRARSSDSINIIEVEKHARFAYPLSTFILTL